MAQLKRQVCLLPASCLAGFPLPRPFQSMGPSSFVSPSFERALFSFYVAGLENKMHWAGWEHVLRP